MQVSNGRRLTVVIGVALALAAAACTGVVGSAAAGGPRDVTQIQHIVVMMQENRSYDSYFGPLHVEGQPASAAEPTTPNPNPLGGIAISPFLHTAPCEVADLNHSWNGTHAEWDNGNMDGFTAANVNPADPTGSRTMAYYDQATLSFYYALANKFAIADHYFSSVLSQTFPNRFYLLTGTSFGHIRNDFPPTGGFTQKTVFQLLDEATPAVSWKIYLSNFGVEQLFSYVQQHSAGHVVPLSQYYTDAANGTLPQVSFVESSPFGGANVESDEHPPANVQVGQRFTHDVINALVHSPNWLSSALFLTYDEHGGFYDHVAPPAAPKPDNIAPILQPGDTPAAFDRYGIRVPTIVVSPYARNHFVSHRVYDHTSILRFIETRFRLHALTQRDHAADPMLSLFDFTHVTHPAPVLADAPIDPAGVDYCNRLHPQAAAPAPLTRIADAG
ncbi:MAG: phospholipase [Actinomycetota bacterium]|nr:phospholipase [Actinomycetota bacterium]